MNDDGPSAATIIGGLLVCGALGIAWLWYSGSEAPSLPRSGGFDADTTSSYTRPAPAPAPRQLGPTASPSSLGLFRAGDALPPQEPASAAPPPAAPRSDPRERAKDALIRNDAKMRDFVARMMKKYPSIGQYDKDWSSHPDLKRLQDDYWKDRDVAKFLVGVAQSDNFGKMMRKYATDPGVRGFAVEMITTGPKEVVGALTGLSSADGTVNKLLGSVMSGLGLPPSLTNAIAEGKGDQIDQKQVVSEILKSNPALANPAAREALLQQGALTPSGQGR